MDAAFAGGAFVILSPNFRFSLYFSLLFRNFEFGDGFECDWHPPPRTEYLTYLVFSSFLLCEFFRWFREFAPIEE